MSDYLIQKKIMDSVYQNLNIIMTKEEIIYMNQQGEQKKKLTLTLDDVRKQFLEIGLVCPYSSNNYNQYYSELLENRNIPLINFIFYYLIFCLMRIPTINEVVNSYINIHCVVYPNGYLRFKPQFGLQDVVFTKEQLTGRIFRAIPSFYREIELFFQLRCYDDLYIEYNFYLDKNGVDLILIKNNKTFCLASYYDSKRSDYFKDRKNVFRHDYSQFNNINFKLNKNNCCFYNNIYTYKPSEVANIYIEILQNS